MRLFRQVTMNDERLEKFPFKRELAMQAYVLEHPQILKLDGKYDDVEIYEEEIPIKGGGKSKDGRIDMVASYSGEHIAIIEFKNTKLVEDSLKQLEGYLKQKEELEKLAPRVILDSQNKKTKWIGILVGTSIEPELEHKISSGHLYKDIPIAAIIIERFRSATGNVYITTDTYFKSNLSGRSNKQYEFNGELYGIGRLVLKVVKAQAKKYENITYNQLLKSFSSERSGGVVFERLEIAKEKNKGKETLQHYIKDADIIELRDGPIAVTDKWGKHNIDKFIARATELGFKIEDVTDKRQTGNTRPAKDINKPSRDYTKYEFNGILHHKNRLVLAVIKQYVKENQKTTYAKLRMVFSKNLSNNGVFDTLEVAHDINNRNGHPRHFIKDEDVVKLSDGETIAVSTEWSITNNRGFLIKARKLGYEITEIKD